MTTAARADTLQGMIIDCHVHVSACTPAHGGISPKLLNAMSMRFVRWRFGLVGFDESTECAFEEKLVETIDGTPRLDAAVVLAFDAVYDEEGRLDRERTHFHVTNDYVMKLARRHRKVLFGASVHPYRADAVEELERCITAGAVLVKWLPLTQGFDPSDKRCIPFYEAMAHHKMTLLSHTGWEQALPTINDRVADPALLRPALERGVKVIAAHCGTRALPWNSNFLPQFVRMAKEYEHFYGDTSALSLPTRSYAYDVVLEDPQVRSKLVHGSDWPIIPMPPVRRLGWPTAAEMMMESNWMQRDVLIKERLGFDEAYWRRGAEVMGVGRNVKRET